MADSIIHLLICDVVRSVADLLIKVKHLFFKRNN